MPDALTAFEPTPILDSRKLPDDPRAHWLDLEYFELDAGFASKIVVPDNTLILYLGEDPVSCMIERDGVQYDLTLAPETFVVAPAQCRLSARWDGPFKSLRIIIREEVARRFVETEVGIPAIGERLHNEITFNNPELAKTAISMRDSLTSIGLASDVIFDGLARVFLATLVRNYAEQTPNLSRRAKHIGPSEYRILLEYVQNNLSRTIRVNDLADQLAMSPSHFSRAFKAATHKSPMEFVTQLRINQAHDYLLHSDMPLSVIAFKCGFSDQAHFTHSFKSHTALNPSDIRKHG